VAGSHDTAALAGADISEKPDPSAPADTGRRRCLAESPCAPYGDRSHTNLDGELCCLTCAFCKSERQCGLEDIYHDTDNHIITQMYPNEALQHAVQQRSAPRLGHCVSESSLISAVHPTPGWKPHGSRRRSSTRSPGWMNWALTSLGRPDSTLTCCRCCPMEHACRRADAGRVGLPRDVLLLILVSAPQTPPVPPVPHSRLSAIPHRTPDG
jgi:hypothetical protein